MRKLQGILVMLMACLLATTAYATSSSAVTYEEKTVDGITMKVVIVDQTNPNIETKVVLEDSTLGTTDSFYDIVAEQDAVVSINGNFFTAYDTYKEPIGNLMSEGEMLYSSAGMPNFGVTTDGELLFGIPGYFIYLTFENSGQSFLAYDVNLVGQYDGLLRLYTAAYGSSVNITTAGTVYVFQNDVFTGSQAVSAGTTVTIPSNGMVLFQYQGAESWAYPVNVDSYIGKTVDVSYFLKTGDSDTVAEFEGKTLESILSGNVYLVKNGAVLADMVYGSEGSSDSRWTESAARTAIGQLVDGRLVMVSTASATLKGLASAMVSLGCTEAINLDGGASRAMAVDGTVVVPAGRELTVTFHVYDTGAVTVPVVEEEPVIEEPVALHPFTDVVEGSYYEDAVVWALETGVTTGMTDTTFVPADSCTRGQVVTFLWRACGEPAPAITENPFTDVDASSPYYTAILWAVGEGITTGATETTFEPSTVCTTGQVLTFLYRANGAPEVGDSDWATQYPNRYFTDALAWAGNAGLLSAVTESINPDGDSPRAYVVTYLYANAGSPVVG
ncbi:phosphodiester glycosidase family protein [Bengtsoniella intestinalis]|uniref:phosphodiester glycosidase family protein n=1 Tax=Bengtsoniella intestinalis TaxID=3073143 RepID=UPI00391F7BCF